MIEINLLSEMLNQIDNEKDEHKKIEIAMKNLDNIQKLNDEFEEIANNLLMKEYQDEEQNQKSNILKNIIINILKNTEVFNVIEEVQHLNLTLIDNLAHYENRLIYRLRRGNSIEIIYEALEYQKDREEYISTIKNNVKLDGNTEVEKAIKKYVEDPYDITIFESVMNIIRDNEDKISKEDLEKMIQEIDSTRYIKNILSKDDGNLKEIEKLMLQRYASIIVKLKGEMFPELLKKDALVRAFVKGKLKNETLSLIVSNAIPIYDFESLLFAMSLEDKSKILTDIKIRNLKKEEMEKIDELLEKAGIKIQIEVKDIDEDNNFLVSVADLKKQYEDVDIRLIYKEKEKLYKANINEIKEKDILDNTQRKAYLEISTIINMMTNQMRSKINAQFIDFIERNKLKKKKCDINPNIKLSNQKIENEETRALLGLIYRDYVCSESKRRNLTKDEKIRLLNKDSSDDIENEIKVSGMLSTIKKIIKK